MLAPYTDLPLAHKILKECETTVLPWAKHWASDVSSGECAYTVLVCLVSALCGTESFYVTVIICQFLLLLSGMSGLWWYDKWTGRKWELITVRWKRDIFFSGKHSVVLWHDFLTLQRGVTSTARHSVNITCRGVTSPARHAARSHSFVYISTS